MNTCATHTITKKKYEGIFPRKDIFNVIVNLLLNFYFSINGIFEDEKRLENPKMLRHSYNNLTEPCFPKTCFSQLAQPKIL